MDHFKEDILNSLKDLKGSGKFVSMQTMKFVFPGMEVAGVGEMAYPINEAQAKALIQVAHKAPFGKGSETIVDNKVRSGWEIDADNISFKGNRWEHIIQKIIHNIQPDLGLEEYTISAHLYKMLIYEAGDFFLPHQDSEKEKGMFGTLVIGLPSKYTGGELVVRFGGVEETADFAAEAGDYKINYTAFYADCEHEVKPLTSGYRVCLTYNLVQEKSGKKIQFNSLASYVEKLAAIFRNPPQADEQKPHIVLLGHQYTPENFSVEALKLNDRPKAEALFRAAKEANCYAKMCLVTSYITGLPDEDGYGYGYDDEGDENAKMVEVYDESLYIEHWLEKDIPLLSNVSFEEDDLITSFALNEEEPIIKESSGYMGNYGPDLMHWYHYGAIMIWSHETNAQLLTQQDTESKLAWIDYFNKNPQQLSDNENSTIELILSSALSEDDKDANYNTIADWIIHQKDDTFLLRLNDELRQSYFTKIDPAHWLKLIEFFPVDITDKIFELVTDNIRLPVVAQILSILQMLLKSEKDIPLVKTQVKKLPQYFSALSTSTVKKDFPPTAGTLNHLFEIEKMRPQDEVWENNLAEILMSCTKRDYINRVLAPQLLELTTITGFTRKILSSCRQYLQEKTSNEPQPPADWSRKIPETTRYKKQWQLLKDFLASPVERVFDYRINQNERNEMESAIRNVEIDLRTETIKKGSPHTLRITKTQASYKKKMKEWDEDVK
ncbi:MAG: 2OG-Fe(II) oxygenase, partial [Chitinophagaceae bacterium]